MMMCSATSNGLKIVNKAEMTFTAMTGPLNVTMPTVTYDTLDKVIAAAGELGQPMYNGLQR